MPLPASKVAGVRITRKNGNYRQSWYTERRNRSVRGVDPIKVSSAQDNSAAEYPKDGRLKVVAQRDFLAKVPFEMSEGKFSFEDAADPINQLGPVFEGMEPLVTSNDFESFLAAFGKRSNFQQAAEDDDISDDVFAEALNIIDSLPDDLFEEWDETDEDYVRWLSKFDTHKVARMKAASEEMAFCDARYIGTKDLSVKIEVLLKRMDPKWAPRIIYAGNDVFNRVTGPAMMVAMERLQVILGKASVGPVNVKLAYKTNDVSIVEFLDDDRYPNAYEGDFSANDKEQRSRVATLTDRWLAKLRMPQWLRNLLLELEEYKVQNRRFGVVAKLKFQLPTGTTSTTFRNSTYNMTMFAVACVRQLVPTYHEMSPSERRKVRPKAKAVVLGDDILAVVCAFFCIHLWKSVVDAFKMVLKGKDVKLCGQATLLSRRIIIDGDTKCMLPLIGKALARFNARASNNQEVSDSQYMAGKALSYAYEFRHVPFLRDMFLQRYDMEDSAAVTLDDLTWFTRTSGIELSNIVEAIKNEKIIVSDDMFLDWLMPTYDLGLCELEEIAEIVILSNERVCIEHYAVDKLAVDW